MFICTFSDEIYEQLKDRLKLIQRVKNYDKTLYVFAYDKLIFERYSGNKEIWLSDKLYF